MATLLGDVALQSREGSPLLQRSASLSSDTSTNDNNTNNTTNDEGDEEHPVSEITIRGVIISLVLSIIFISANAYLGLFAGITIGVSIPSAIMTMAMIYPFGGNILEVNAIQTGAASGSSITSGIIFTLPALFMLSESQDSPPFWDYNKHMYYGATTAVGILGGIMGVMFSSPLRRALIIENPLKFPEGFATAEILKLMEVTEDRGSQILLISVGAATGFIIKLLQSGFLLWSPDFEFETKLGEYLFYFGMNLSPALLAVGYIVGLAAAAVIFLGGTISWWIVIPVLYAINIADTDDTEDITATELWTDYAKYIGVGAMLTGGLGTIILMFPSLYSGIKSAVRAYKRVRATGLNSVSRTERDLPIPLIGISFLFLVPGCFTVLFLELGHEYFWIAFSQTIFVTIFGFLFSAVGAYMAGVVGSSNNPISGMTLATIVTSGLSVLLILTMMKTNGGLIGPAAAIFIGAVVCCAAAVAGDNMQDLKSGHLVGATPLKQQIMQLVGVILPGFLISPIVFLLIRAYGLGKTGKKSLQAPQATLMLAVAKSIFKGSLPLEIIAVGMGIAAVIFVVDFALKKANSRHRLPVLAAALGMYLPFSLSTPIVIGGFIMVLANFVLTKLGVQGSEKENCMRKGLLFSAGLITGEALVGIIIAIPIVFTEDTNFMAVFGDFTEKQAWPGVLAFIFAGIGLFTSVVGKTIYEERQFYRF